MTYRKQDGAAGAPCGRAGVGPKSAPSTGGAGMAPVVVQTASNGRCSGPTAPRVDCEGATDAGPIRCSEHGLAKDFAIMQPKDSVTWDRCCSQKSPRLVGVY